MIAVATFPYSFEILFIAFTVPWEYDDGGMEKDF